MPTIDLEHYDPTDPAVEQVPSASDAPPRQ
jgi:hypothetical protein